MPIGTLGHRNIGLEHLFDLGAKGGKISQLPPLLELGGKCPVIIDDDYPISEAAQRILWGKTFNAAQTCVAPDYALVPKGEVNTFVESISKHYSEHFPAGAIDDSYTSIIDQKNYARLNALIDDARAGGATIHVVERPTAKLAAASH